MNTTILGLDVSRHNGKINWKTAYQVGARIAAIRFTVGDYYVDETTVYNYHAAREAGFEVTLYNVIAPARSGDPSTRITGADHTTWFIRNALAEFGTEYIELDHPLIWDCELHRGQDPRWCTSVTQVCFEGAQGYSGHNYPMCYTSAGYWNANIFPSSSWMLYPLFVANWFVQTPTLPRDWNTWKAHQYSNKGDGKMYGQERGSIDLSYWKSTTPPDPPTELPEEEVILESILTIGEQTYQGSTKFEMSKKQSY
jgi:GH25 family lysozyme M1 (1,4-beta-N-acetylmuramidase)